ncbi:MAG: AAA family ATPase [Candidatus Diapherotrites archaeon]|uniref:AAA family ATPase n=1 Tax=Candidatus Iainarchaeum sp. TaxID=3101447 RepID=A0A8T3YLN2_9ARCH|nr:AAA family ATPase [Candidatus Diapherotrites archaeon]
MGRVIALISGKGGVGKTSITANLGIALAKRGLSVCLVDADIAMANLSLLLNMQNSPITLHDVLLGEASVQDAIYDGPAGVRFMPSGLSLENYRRVDSERLHAVIESIKQQYDFVLLDCAAGIEKNVIAAISASDEVLLITMPTSPSIADVLKAKITSQRLGSKAIGVIINFVRYEKGEIKKDDIVKMLELPVLATVPYDDEMRKSFMFETASPVMIRRPNAPSAVSIQLAAAKLAGLPVSPEAAHGDGLVSGILNKLRSMFGGKPKQAAAQSGFQ